MKVCEESKKKEVRNYEPGYCIRSHSTGNVYMKTEKEEDTWVALTGDRVGHFYLNYSQVNFHSSNFYPVKCCIKILDETSE